MKKGKSIPNFNPVAKHARTFNKAQVFKNKKLDYFRNPKHRKNEEE